MTLTQSQTQKLKALMLASHKPAFFVVNKNMELLEWSEDLELYGFSGLAIGVDTTDIFDFLVGYDGEQELELPIVSMPSGVHASVSTVIEEGQINILILDASHDFEQQYLLQQKANDAQLYNMRMQKLMRELVETQKLLEHKNQQLAESARLQSRFLSGVSHEFRTPLTSLIGFTDVLHEKISDQSSIEQLAIIKGSAKYMLSLVENLLDHGRLDSSGLSLQFASVDIQELITIIIKMLQPLADSKGLQLLDQVDVGSKYLMIDQIRVQQCIINVANNAIKFTESGQITINVVWQDDFLTVDIIDSGIGMTPEELGSLFTAFWQSDQHDQPGTGLGMTITKRLLEMMGGDLSIHSKPGNGTTVSLNIPASFTKENKAVENRPVIERENGQYHILLVEDDEDIADLLTLKLSSWGYQVSHCVNGHECIKWIGPNQVDLILMDLSMPVLNGEDTLKYLRETGCKTPVYIMSAKPLLDGSMIDAQGHFLKPIDFEQLSQVLHEVFTIV